MRHEGSLIRVGSTAAWLFAIGASGVDPTEAACGCAQMTLRGGSTAGVVQSGIYCTTEGVPTGCAAAGDAGTEGCPEGATPYRCPLGPMEPVGDAAGNFGWGFEIVVTTTDDSDLDDCPEGQANSATIHMNGSLQPNPTIFDDEPPAGDRDFAGELQVTFVSGVPVPQYGAAAGGRLTLGSDDYVAPSLVKIHDEASRTIRWVDTPLTSVSAGEQWTEQSQFLSFVQGSADDDPQCWCLFTIDHGWNAGTRTAASVTLDQAHNCVSGP